jgi:hypothetical protein
MADSPARWTDETQDELVRLSCKSDLFSSSFATLQCVVALYCHKHHHAYKTLNENALIEIFMTNVAHKYADFEVDGMNRVDSAIIGGTALAAATIEQWWNKVVS